MEEERDEFDSRVRIYRLRNEPMSALKAWLEATETMWTRQLVAFKAHIEQDETMTSQVYVALRVPANPLAGV